MIPKQLQKKEFRFCLLKSKEKIPFEKAWQTNGYKFDDKKLLDHINKGGNYGVIGGYGNLIILDKDNDKLNIDLETLTIKTGSGGKHYYLISPYKENHVFVDELGELRAFNYQCVGCGCIHPNGNKYTIEKDLPILKISKDDIQKLIEPYLRTGTTLTTPTGDFKGKDTSKSGDEMRIIIPLIRKGKSKEEVFKKMEIYNKWVNSHKGYRETTYSKAVLWCHENPIKKVEVVNEPKQKLSEKEVKQILKQSYKNIIILLKKYCDIREDYYPLIACWIIGTHFHKEFNTYPYLFFNAMKGSGKTRILKLIASLIPNGDLLNDLSESVLFRTAYGNSFCIDEFEDMNGKEKNTLKLLLNSAYKKGAKVKRMKKTEKDDYEVETFEVYCPIAMANIGGIQNVLEDRCISLILEKSNDKKRTKLVEDFETNSLILDTNSLFSKGEGSLGSYTPFQEATRGWNNYILNTKNLGVSPYSLESHNSLNSLYNKINNIDLDGRDLELFLPLYLIANLCNILDEILIISRKITEERKEKDLYEGKDVQLYDFISQSNYESFVPINSLTKDFRLFLELEDKQEKWINNRWMGNNLKKLVLVREKKKIGTMRVVLNIEKAKEKIKMFKPQEEKVEVIKVGDK